MFYCEPCREERNWPESMCKSYGRCEICENSAVCNDRASSTLPLPPDYLDSLLELRRAELRRLEKEVRVAQQGPELCQGHIPNPSEGPEAYEMCYMPLPCSRAHLHEDTGQ